MSELWDPLFGMTRVARTVDDQAWLATLCEVEGALAQARARVGLIDKSVANQISTACDEVGQSAASDIGQAAVADGNPVTAIVAAVVSKVRLAADETAASEVHRGATSQDIVDTAMMLVAHRGLGVVFEDLTACADAAADHARQHRDSQMVGRTLLQPALPTTFGAVCAQWGMGLDRAATQLASARARLPVQLGGAVGTMNELFPHGPAVRAALADELGLANPDSAWHTERGVVRDVGAALGHCAAAVSKVAIDVVLLAQREIGEVRESSPGGASGMPHKQNPIAAVTARAAAAQAPGLVATLFGVAPELERGAGPWHVEWPATNALLRAAGGAAARLRASLVGLDVDIVAMQRNLALLPESVRDAGLGHASDIVDGYLRRRQS